MFRPLIPISDINKVLEEVLDMIIMRMEQPGHGAGAFASSHEIYGVIAEEFNKELLDALHANDDIQFRKELIDIAVGAIFGIASLDVKEDIHD